MVFETTGDRLPAPHEQALPEPIILKRRWLELRDELIVAWERYRFLRDMVTDRMLRNNSEMQNQKIMFKNLIQSKTIGLFLALEVKLKFDQRKQFHDLIKAIYAPGPVQLDLEYLKDCFLKLNQVLKRIGLFNIEKKIYSPEQEVLDTGEQY